MMIHQKKYINNVLMKLNKEQKQKQGVPLADLDSLTLGANDFFCGKKKKNYAYTNANIK
jgi:hypothetical protein